MTVEKAIEYMRKNELAFFRVEYAGKLAFKSSEATDGERVKEPSLEESIVHFQSNMDMYQDGAYVLIARKNVKGTAGEQRFPFFKKESVAAQMMPTVSGFGIGEMQQSWMQVMDSKLEVERVRNQMELQGLRHAQELKEAKEKLKAKADDLPLDKIAGIIGQVQQLLSAANGTPLTGTGLSVQPIVAGPVPLVHAQLPVQDETQRIQQALEKLHVLTGGRITATLEGFARLGETQPGMFQTYLPMILTNHGQLSGDSPAATGEPDESNQPTQ